MARKTEKGGIFRNVLCWRLNIARKLKIMENEKHPHDDLKNVEITKELINMNLLANEKEYNWLCDEYNRTFFKGIKTAKPADLKGILWTFPLWRSLIGFLQRTGIMRVIKNILGRK